MADPAHVRSRQACPCQAVTLAARHHRRDCHAGRPRRHRDRAHFRRRRCRRSRARCSAGCRSRRLATLRTFRDAQRRTVDEGIALYFPAPHSYTGEPVLELQGHGGPVVMQALLARLPGRRRAPRRAGRVHAARVPRRQARPGAGRGGRRPDRRGEPGGGALGAALARAASSRRRSARLSAQLVELRALTEAMLDFPEEEVDALHRDDAAARLARVRAALDEVLAKSRQGSLLRSGIHVVLAGRPNVGKSSLLNRLAGEERAIVTPMPGTTRDALREPVQIEGVPLVVVDTAGLRESRDEIERLGMERARQRARRAPTWCWPCSRRPGAARRARQALPAAGGAHRRSSTRSISRRASARRRRGCDRACRRRPARASMRCARRCSRPRAGSSSGESVFLARERHLRALEARARHLAAAAGESSALGVVRRGVAPRAGGAGRDHRRVQRRDLLGRDLRALLHRQMSAAIPAME